MNLEGLTEKVNKKGKAIYFVDELEVIIAKGCSKCGEIKYLHDFSKSKSGLGGVRGDCKVCHSVMDKKYADRRREYNQKHYKENTEYYRQWHLDNRDRRLLAQKANYIQNREERKELNRKYYENNKERVLKKNRKWAKENAGRKAELHQMWYEKNKERLKHKSRKLYLANKEIVNKRSRDWYNTNKEYHAELALKWRKSNPEKSKLYAHRYRARKYSLPYSLTNEEYKITLEYFGNACALTGQTETLEKEHAIPISIGHGGTTFGNCYPMINGLNQSKSNQNIFEWFEANRQRFKLEQWRFDRLINWLASANAMSVEEYRAYVYECHANPNEIETKEAN